MATSQTDRTGGPAAVATQTDRTGGPAAAIVTDRAQGLVAATAVKGPCTVATTAEITLAGEQTIDGEAVTAGKRVLVKDQSDARQNGIWLAATGDWVRAADFFGSEAVRKGTRVFVTDGTVNGSTEFAVTTADPITVGTTAISFAVSSALQAAGIVTDALHAAPSKSTPADADELSFWDSVAQALKKATALEWWGNYFKPKADALYLALASVATAAQFIANTASKVLTTSGVWTAAAPVNLGAALTGTVALDYSTFLSGYGTLIGNITLGATSELKPGQTGTLTFTQSGGPWTLSVDTTYYSTNGGSGISLGSGRNKLTYEVQENGKIFLSLAGKAIA